MDARHYAFETGRSLVFSRPSHDFLVKVNGSFIWAVKEQAIDAENCHISLEEMLVYWAQISFFLSWTALRQELQNVIGKVLHFHKVKLKRS